MLANPHATLEELEACLAMLQAQRAVVSKDKHKRLLDGWINTVEYEITLRTQQVVQHDKYYEEEFDSLA